MQNNPLQHAWIHVLYKAHIFNQQLKHDKNTEHSMVTSPHYVLMEKQLSHALDVLFRVQLQTKYSPTKSEQSKLIKQIEISLQVLVAASELYKLRKQPQNESKINEVHTVMQNNFNKTLDAAYMAISKSTICTVNLT